MSVVIEEDEDHNANGNVSSNSVQISDDGNILSDYSSWLELAEDYYEYQAMAGWDAAGIPYKGIFFGNMRIKDISIDPIIIWDDERVAVCESADMDSLSDFSVCGWRFFDINANPEEILNALKEGDE